MNRDLHPEKQRSVTQFLVEDSKRGKCLSRKNLTSPLQLNSGEVKHERDYTVCSFGLHDNGWQR